MLETFEKDLNSVLKGCNKKIIRHVANHMIDSSYSELSIKAALQHLLSEGCRTTEILAALVRCEWKSLNMILPRIKKLDEQKQARQLRGMIERFNAIQGALISVSEESWQKKVMQEGRSRVLIETRNAWMKDQHIILYNLFEEMPVRASAYVTKWDGNILHTQVTPELGRVFSADPEMRYAFIDSQIEGFRIKVIIDAVRGVDLQLKVVKIDASELRRRERIRVGLETCKPVQLFSADILVCTAKLADVSISGLGLIATEEPPFVLGEKLRCQIQIGKAQVNHVGEVVWAQPFLEGGRFGMKMEFGKVIQRKLNSEILNMQRSKIERLTRLGMPHTLRQKY